MRITTLLYVLSLSLFSCTATANITVSTTLPIKKVVIWGHKLHTHTHSYIHFAFYRAFKHLGYDTYWFDNSDNIHNFDFSNSFFITEWQVDQNMPLRDDCFYAIHNMNEGNRYAKYKHLVDIGHAFNFRGYQVASKKPHKHTKIDEYSYGNLPKKTLFILWGTDLLPHEIDKIKKRLSLKKKSRTVYWIGSISGGPGSNLNEVEPFKRACALNGIRFEHKTNLSMEENIALIQQSYMAPAIQGSGQCERDYIPCRIFKNISYGQFGITNCKAVWELFDRKIVYNPDTNQLFYDAQRKLQNLNINELYELMDIVKTKHTYINRIQTMFTFMEMVYEAHKK